MAITHLKDGEDFSAKHFDKSFGFSGSAEGYDSKSAAPPFAASKPTKASHSENEDHEEYTGPMGDQAPGVGMPEHMHPHGHDVVRSEPHEHGGVIMHHAHGGFSIHHKDGHVTHHHADGGSVMVHPDAYSRGGSATHVHPHGHRVSHVTSQHDREIHHHEHGGYTVKHDDGRITHHGHDGHPVGAPGMAMGGEKAMIAKGIHQHEDHEHDGEHTDIKLARGGMPGMGKLPRGMRPKVAHAHPLGEESALNRPPMNPMHTATPRNSMPGGQMGYGVEPSAEPDPAGSEMPGGGFGMKRGGRHKRE